LLRLPGGLHRRLPRRLHRWHPRRHSMGRWPRPSLAAGEAAPWPRLALARSRRCLVEARRHWRRPWPRLPGPRPCWATAFWAWACWCPPTFCLARLPPRQCGQEAVAAAVAALPAQDCPRQARLVGPRRCCRAGTRSWPSTPGMTCMNAGWASCNSTLTRAAACCDEKTRPIICVGTRSFEPRETHTPHAARTHAHTALSCRQGPANAGGRPPKRQKCRRHACSSRT
jgi:hypothetical protein